MRRIEIKKSVWLAYGCEIKMKEGRNDDGKVGMEE